MKNTILICVALAVLANLITALLIYASGVDITERGSGMLMAVMFHLAATAIPPFLYLSFKHDL